MSYLKKAPENIEMTTDQRRAVLDRNANPVVLVHARHIAGPTYHVVI